MKVRPRTDRRHGHLLDVKEYLARKRSGAAKAKSFEEHMSAKRRSEEETARARTESLLETFSEG